MLTGHVFACVFWPQPERRRPQTGVIDVAMGFSSKGISCGWAAKHCGGSRNPTRRGVEAVPVTCLWGTASSFFPGFRSQARTPDGWHDGPFRRVCYEHLSDSFSVRIRMNPPRQPPRAEVRSARVREGTSKMALSPRRVSPARPGNADNASGLDRSTPGRGQSSSCTRAASRAFLGPRVVGNAPVWSSR